MTAYQSGERSGSGGFNQIVWPFKMILFAGFAIFTVQIVAEIIKRAASLMGRPVVAEGPPADLSDHGV